MRRELSRPGYQPGWIQLGANTNAYQPIERRLEIMRGVLQVLAEFLHPVGITTKSDLVVRDIDMLRPMAARNLAMVAVSLTTLDRGLARAMEPSAATPERRLEAIRQLAAAGIPIMVGVSPLIPGLSDHELETILERAAKTGATAAYYRTLRLPREVCDLFVEWLSAERPDRGDRVMSLLWQMRNGHDNDPRFGLRMRGEGLSADLLERRFRVATHRLGLQRRLPPLNVSKFRRSLTSGERGRARNICSAVTTKLSLG